MECKTISTRRSTFMTVFVAAATLFLAALPLQAQQANGVLIERWNGITGNLVTNLTSIAAYPNSPSTRTYTGSHHEIPTDAADNYGIRTRGYITAPTTGSYTFWIAGDDFCELWLGTNADPATVRLIANVPGWTTTRLWTKYPAQQSAAITLAAGTRYFIEVRYKESLGGDNMAVGWQGPGITGEAERPIPNSRLTPYIIPPSITTQPANAAVLLGQPAIFAVAASSPTASTYQWSRNGVALPGATAASYTTPATLETDQDARFTVTVTNGGGSVTSAQAILTVNIPAGVVTHPVSQSVNAGSQVTFLVVARGTAPITYQWRRGATAIPGATSPSYTFTAAASDNGIAFDVLVINAFGNVTSNSAILTVTSAPVITTQPANQTVNAPAGATFSVVATGQAPLTYQWRRDGVSLPGQTSATYTLASTVGSDNGARFSVVVTNAQGSTPSNEAVLTVRVAPAISTQPAPQTVPVGQSATFNVTASGTAPLTYAWRRNGTAIPGAVSASYTTPAATLGDQGALFSVMVSNAAGSATSSSAILTVLNNATNNRKLAISGELVDAAGNPVGYPTPVTVDAVVVLFNAATGGTALFTEEFHAAANQGILVQNGLFVARLGEGTTAQNLQSVLSANANLFTEITIHDGTPDVLAPRTPITASAYSMVATPAAATAGLQGDGNPNTLGVEAAVGATWVDTRDNSTWFRLQSGWKAMD